MNRSIADHVREVREELERGRAEIDRQRRVLHELHSTAAEDEAAA